MVHEVLGQALGDDHAIFDLVRCWHSRHFLSFRPSCHRHVRYACRNTSAGLVRETYRAGITLAITARRALRPSRRSRVSTVRPTLSGSVAPATDEAPISLMSAPLLLTPSGP